MEAGIAVSKLIKGFLAEDEWGRLGIASGRLGNSNIYIKTTTRLMEAIRSIDQCEVIPDIVIVDGIEIFDEGVTQTGRMLKEVAIKNNIPILGSIGITDWHERRADRRPMLQDIINGEVIKYIADKIIFMYRDDYYNEESEFKGLCEIIIPKNNTGPIGTVILNFLEELNKFSNYIQLID